ncbi:hypothetical protein JCM11491_004210 [Sporobolomyces phaffii]
MQPYRFPRSQGSLDLTDPNLPPATFSSSVSSPEIQHPRPSFVITNATPQDGLPRSATEQQHLARMTSATQNLLSQPKSSAPSPQHLSIGGLSTHGGGSNGKTLSRISEYSESAYSDNGSSRTNSQQPEPREPSGSVGGLTPSASTSTNDSSNNGTTPTTMSFSFPAPPAHSSPPAPTIPLPQIPHEPRETVVSPSPWAYPALPGSPSRSHLPSRPITALTTPLPTSNPNPVPVPIAGFAPQFSRTDSHPDDSTMVQIPGRTVTGISRASYHQPQPSDSTAWTLEGKYSTDKSSPYLAYDAVSIAPSHSTNGGGGESNHRFTLDNNEKSPSRLGNVLPVKKGANRTLLWFLAIVAVIGIALGTGLGVGLKNLKKENNVSDGVVGVGSSSSPSSDDSSPSQSVLLPTSTRISSDSPAGPAASTVAFESRSDSAASSSRDAVAETLSTTFGYRIGSKTTVVPLSYTVPTSYFTRDDGRIQFTQQVVLPSLDGQGSFTSDLRFRIPATETASSSAPANTAVARSRLAKRDLQGERVGDRRRWERKSGFQGHRERRSHRVRDIR